MVVADFTGRPAVSSAVARFSARIAGLRRRGWRVADKDPGWPDSSIADPRKRFVNLTPDECYPP